MDRVELLTPASNIPDIIGDLRPLLRDPSNADIATEFPMSAQRYSGDFSASVYNLEAAAADCEPGRRRQFIVFAGERAVGMSVVRIDQDAPKGIDPAWPNLSGFVCNPYRGQGLGQLSLRARLAYVEAEFGGRAWTQVKAGNAPSLRIVQKCGFLPIRQDGDSILFQYGS